MLTKSELQVIAPLTQVCAGPSVSVLDGDVESWGTKGGVMHQPGNVCFKRKDPVTLLFSWHNPSPVECLQRSCGCWNHLFPQSTVSSAQGELGFQSSALLFIHSLTTPRDKSPLWLTRFHFANQWDSTTRAEESFLRTCVAQSPEWVQSSWNYPEPNSWAPWGSHHTPSLSGHSGLVQAPPSLGNSLPCVGRNVSKAVINRAAGVSQEQWDGTEMRALS